MNKLRLIKMVVVLLTFLIVLGMIAAGHIIYKRGVKPAVKDVVELNLNQPQGSYVSDIKTSPEMVYLFVKGGKKADRIIAIRQIDAAVVANISLY